jgi:hydrogenase 3 maturation protease
VARALGARLAAAGPPGPAGAPTVLVLDAGPAPENQTGPLRRFAPDLVILVDAARMQAAPGTIRWLPWEATVGLPGSTHTLPASLLARYLTAELGCAVALLGIQPLDMEIGHPMSPSVAQAVSEVVGGLAELFGI